MLLKRKLAMTNVFINVTQMRSYWCSKIGKRPRLVVEKCGLFAHRDVARRRTRSQSLASVAELDGSLFCYQ